MLFGKVPKDYLKTLALRPRGREILRREQEQATEVCAYLQLLLDSHVEVSADDADR